MPFYPVTPPDVTSSGVEDAGLDLLGLAGMAAVRAANLAPRADAGWAGTAGRRLWCMPCSSTLA